MATSKNPLLVQRVFCWIFSAPEERQRWLSLAWSGGVWPIRPLRMLQLLQLLQLFQHLRPARQLKPVDLRSTSALRLPGRAGPASLFPCAPAHCRRAGTSAAQRAVAVAVAVAIDVAQRTNARQKKGEAPGPALSIPPENLISRVARNTSTAPATPAHPLQPDPHPDPEHAPPATPPPAATPAPDPLTD